MDCKKIMVGGTWIEFNELVTRVLAWAGWSADDRVDIEMPIWHAVNTGTDLDGYRYARCMENEGFEADSALVRMFDEIIDEGFMIRMSNWDQKFTEVQG